MAASLLSLIRIKFVGCRIRSLSEVHSILVQLEEIGDEETVDWKIIIGDHLYFETISSAEFPPLYNEQDFETPRLIGSTCTSTPTGRNRFSRIWRTFEVDTVAH
jgi:hypothetical protein